MRMPAAEGASVDSAPNDPAPGARRKTQSGFIAACLFVVAPEDRNGKPHAMALRFHRGGSAFG